MSFDGRTSCEQVSAGMPDLAVLPRYPEFVPIARDHKAVMDAAFQAVQPEISEFSFAYQWVWGRRAKCQLSRFKGAIIISGQSLQDGRPYLLPPVIPDLDEAADLMLAVLRLSTDPPADAFARLTQTMVDRLQERAELIVAEEPGRADYVYTGSDLRDLPGRRFHKKRNHIKQFVAAYPEAAYRQMDAALADRCAAFCRDWLESHPDRESTGLRREVDAAIEMLAEREWLGLTGGVIIVDDRIVAFALGEQINRDTFAVRVEKADVTLGGSYQVINQQFARHAAGGLKWINREQDVGDLGLRRAKQSYHPHHMLHRYRVSLP